jgi:hypothetical protein
VGHQAKVSHVKDAVMGVPVVADDATSVNGEDDGRFLKADIVDDLVKGAL